MKPFARVSRALALVSVLAASVVATGAGAAEWRQFRGNSADGHSEAKDLPLTWSDTENVAWKSELPGLGWSSPVVRDNSLWLTTGVTEGEDLSLRLLRLNRQTGELEQSIEVFKLADPGSIHSKNSHASPTPFLDGDNLYLHFGAHGTACVKTSGEIAWKTKLEYAHRHGPGGSPEVFENLLLLNCDGTDIQFVVALDTKTGAEVWRTERAHISEARRTGKASAPMAYSTPLLLEVDGQMQLISSGGDHVAAYNPRNGKEIWWSQYDGYSVVPRPTFGGGRVFVSSGYNRPFLYAIRPTGTGDVTETHVDWVMEKAAPHNPSPLVIGQEVYIVSDRGIATCLDVATGEVIWQERLGGNFSASPLFADGKIYCLDENGKCSVLAPGKEYKLLAANQLPGRTLASPIAMDNVIYLRTDTHLYALSK